MPIGRLSFAVLAACVAPIAWSAAKADPADGIYEGTIGGAKIVASLDGGTGKYFYVSKGLDLFLQIKTKGNQLSVVEKGDDDDAKIAPTGLWDVALKGDALTGNWSPPKGGKTIPIALTRVAPLERLPDDTSAIVFGPAATPYEWRWLAAVEKFRNGPDVRIGELSYQLSTDSVFGTQVPRLTRFPDEAKMKAANRTLDQIQYHMIFSNRDNGNSARDAIALAGSKSVNAVTDIGSNVPDAPKITALTPTVLSFVTTGMWDGGGAHPNQYVDADTIDLSTGLEIANTALPVDPPTDTIFGGTIDVNTPAKRAAFDALWSDKLRKSVAPLAAAAAKKKDSDDRSADEDCADDISGDGFMQDGGASYVLYLKDGGLAVHPDGWANVAAYCFMAFAQVPVILTPAELKPFLVPGQHLIGQ